jgi:iron complex transport system permease protein
MRAGRRLPIVCGYAAAALALFAAVICGLYFGDVKITLGELLTMLSLGPNAVVEEAIKYSVVWRMRLPRVIAATMSGAVLASSGVVFQAVLHNPLAEPYTLGIASGAAFGASIGIYLGLDWVTLAAFIGGIATLLIVWVLGERREDPDVSGIILAGVIAGSILGACMTLLKALAGDKLGAIVVWLMGSFSAASWSDTRPLFLALCIALIFCCYFTQELDIMASGVDGGSVGMDISRTRILVLGGASLAVSFVVSRFGVIGFVGLVVPHLVRILFGPPHRHLLPISLLGGAALLCAADTLAKSLDELPAGVLTVMIGGPVFCFILWRRK